MASAETRKITLLRQKVRRYYQKNGRELPWRKLPENRDARFYRVWISEMMLQQTSVSRVIPYFESWMKQFPTLDSLVNASLGDVLIAWQGLGYNRRAKYIWKAAHTLSKQGIPQDVREMVSLPGIGLNTAAAIAVYCDETRIVFVETNIRTVVLYHFFAQSNDKITDADILVIVDKLMPSKAIREWYWALMDYGAMLKRSGHGRLHMARAYHRQSYFRGSRRELRGKVLRLLADRKRNNSELLKCLNDDRGAEIITELHSEGLIIFSSDQWSLP